jgi:hypothetical protein
MINRYKLQSVVITIILCGIVLSLLVFIRDLQITDILSPLVVESQDNPARISDSVIPSVLGSVVDQTENSVAPTPAPEFHSVTFVDLPKELKEGGLATFTWTVNGEPQIATSTGVYIGLTSNPGILSDITSPKETVYTSALKDFIKGEYIIPLQFVGSMTIPAPGIYYARAYANIEGKQYWSDERTFFVSTIPKNEIRFVNVPTSGKKDENISFSWEVLGPKATTPFTTVVIGTSSKPGKLDTTVTIPQTPYTVLTKDFINGSYDVPLRFVGNARIPDAGNYYFRVLAYINGKNIWSDEYPLTIE